MNATCTQGLTREQREEAARSLIPMASAHATAAKKRNRDLDYEDLFSEAMLALARAIDGFDPSRGASLCTLAWVAINNALRDRVRAIDHRAGRASSFIDGVGADVCSRERTPDEQVMLDEEPEWLKRLTPDELELARQLADGMSRVEIARREGTTWEVIRGRVARLREKIACWGGAPWRLRRVGEDVDEGGEG